jgi:uncharacterized protein YdaL
MKRVASSLLALLFLFSISTLKSVAASNKNNVIFIFDSNASESETTQNFLSRVLMTGVTCTCVGSDQYTQGLIDSYNYVIVYKASDSSIGQNVIRDLTHFSGRILWIGDGLNEFLSAIPQYGISFKGNIQGVQSVDFNFETGKQSVNFTEPADAEIYSANSAHIYGNLIKDNTVVGPYAFSSGNLYAISLADGGYKTDEAQNILLNIFFGSPAQTTGLYIKLDYIYPVSDFNQVSSMAEYLYQKNIPFTFVAMPFYDNASDTAAQNYAKLLQYLVSCGGTPVIHCPVFSQISANDQPQIGEIQQQLNIALKNFAALKVYPLAVEMPQTDLYRSDFTKLFSQFSDYFEVLGDGKDVYTVSSGTPSPIFSHTLVHYTAIQNSVAELRLPQTLESFNQPPSINNNAAFSDFLSEAAFFSNQPYTNYAVSLPSWLTLSNFKNIVDGLVSQNIQFKDYKTGDQKVNFGSNSIENQNGTTIFNGNVVLQNHKSNINTSSAKAPTNTGESEVSNALKHGNTFVIAFSAISLVFLIIAIFIGRKSDKNKYLKRR